MGIQGRHHREANALERQTANWIKGLLPLLKSIHKPCSLKQFSGQTIGVDAYGWLHRGTVTCAMELAMDKPTTK